MLPFAKKKDETFAVSGPVEHIERKPDDESEESFDTLSGAMQELHSALNSKNYKGAADIFRSAFELLESEPHSEGEHV